MLSSGAKLAWSILNHIATSSYCTCPFQNNKLRILCPSSSSSYAAPFQCQHRMNTACKLKCHCRWKMRLPKGMVYILLKCWLIEVSNFHTQLITPALVGIKDIQYMIMNHPRIWPNSELYCKGLQTKTWKKCMQTCQLLIRSVHFQEKIISIKKFHRKVKIKLKFFYQLIRQSFRKNNCAWHYQYQWVMEDSVTLNCFHRPLSFVPFASAFASIPTRSSSFNHANREPALSHKRFFLCSFFRLDNALVKYLSKHTDRKFRKFLTVHISSICWQWLSINKRA